MIFGEKILIQKVRDFCPNLNCDKLTYSIKYDFTVLFVIKDSSYIVTIYFILGEPKFTLKRAQKNRKNSDKK